jgi:hypothetical protein
MMFVSFHNNMIDFISGARTGAIQTLQLFCMFLRVCVHLYPVLIWSNIQTLQLFCMFLRVCLHLYPVLIWSDEHTEKLQGLYCSRSRQDIDIRTQGGTYITVAGFVYCSRSRQGKIFEQSRICVLQVSILSLFLRFSY